MIAPSTPAAPILNPGAIPNPVATHNSAAVRGPAPSLAPSLAPATLAPAPPASLEASLAPPATVVVDKPLLEKLNETLIVVVDKVTSLTDHVNVIDTKSKNQEVMIASVANEVQQQMQRFQETVRSLRSSAPSSPPSTPPSTSQASSSSSPLVVPPPARSIPVAAPAAPVPMAVGAPFIDLTTRASKRESKKPKVHDA